MKISNSMLILSSMLLLSACSGCDEKKNEDTKVVVNNVEDTKATKTMQGYDLGDTLTVAGELYEFAITRKVDTTLQKVSVESGGEFYDNHIHLVIKKKSDGSVFFEKTFNKHFFASIVPSDFLRKSLLLGIVYDYDKANDHSKFNFAASVGDPEDDEMLIPIKLFISSTGSISMEKDNLNNEVPENGGVATIDPTEDQG